MKTIKKPKAPKPKVVLATKNTRIGKLGMSPKQYGQVSRINRRNASHAARLKRKQTRLENTAKKYDLKTEKVQAGSVGTKVAGKVAMTGQIADAASDAVTSPWENIMNSGIYGKQQSNTLADMPQSPSTGTNPRG